MAPFWRNGARSPGVDEWAAVLGDEPVLILLDELPSYLQMAQGEPVGNTTLGDLTIGALERLFNALPRCPRASVVVTNLKDDVYLDGSGQLRTLIESLTKHYDRNAQAITPVQQNTGEVFAIVRKRLFDSLPAADRIDEVAQAYVDALQKAKRADTIATTPETFIERIRETYPFHPSIRDIVARFAENRGYQKTRSWLPLAQGRAILDRAAVSRRAVLGGSLQGTEDGRRPNTARWQDEGLVPDMPIERGDETTRLFRERGWTHWHHLFNARQIVILAIASEVAKSDPFTAISVCDWANYLSRLCGVKSGGAGPRPEEIWIGGTFTNQALNTLFNYGCRSWLGAPSRPLRHVQIGNVSEEVETRTAREVNRTSDIFFTDPPYADAINYH